MNLDAHIAPGANSIPWAHGNLFDLLLRLPQSACFSHGVLERVLAWCFVYKLGPSVHFHLNLPLEFANIGQHMLYA